MHARRNADELLGPDGEVDRGRLDRLLHDYRARLRRMVAVRLDRRVRARVDESDVIQEAYVDVARRLPEYLARPDVPFYVWVRALAAQRVIDLHRHHLGARKRDPRREVPLERRAGPHASSVAIADALAASGSTPSAALARRERQGRLLAALERMKEADREILALRHLEGLTNRECAHVLGLSDSAVSHRYARAVGRLAGAMDADGGAPADGRAV